MVRPAILARESSRTRTGLFVLVLLVAALLLAGPAHGLAHHDADHGDHGEAGGDCHLCHVPIGTFEVVELVPATLGAAGAVPPLVGHGPFARTADRSAPPRAPPVA